MARKKQEIITFKVDQSLSQKMLGVPNRSEFIRTAILAALENVCPLCSGAGVLSPDQRKHWDNFTESHPVVQCIQCRERHLVCTQGQQDPAH